MLTTNQKGLLAEQAVIFECVKLGIGVAKPLDDERYDLILDVGSELWRIQCKWAVQHGEVVVIRLYFNRRGPDGMITRRYSAEDVDGFATLLPGNGTVLLPPGRVSLATAKSACASAQR